MIILSRSLLLSQVASIDLSAPVILWNSLVTLDGLTVGSEAADYPAANLATDSTLEYWRAASTAPVTIEVETAGAEVEAVGVARHNFGSSGATVTVEALISVSGAPDAWTVVAGPDVPPHNSPVLFRFAPVFAQQVRITVEGGTAPPSAAVIYVGKLLVMPHAISTGHVPLDQAMTTQVANGRSEAGHYLGRIITGQSAQTSAAFEMLPIDWYYAEMEGFVARGTAGPFFFAWLPQSQPDDVGFAWLNTDPRPSMGSLFFDVTLDYGGITW